MRPCLILFALALALTSAQAAPATQPATVPTPPAAAPIPHARDAFARGISTLPAGLPVYRHLGIYAYRAAFLARYAELAPAPLERFEALEQLRALWHGHKISVAVTPAAPHAGVDTADDLVRVQALMRGAHY